MSALLLGPGSRLLLGTGSTLLLAPGAEPPTPSDQGDGYVVFKVPNPVERHNDLALRLLLLSR